MSNWRNKCAVGHSVSAKEIIEVMPCEINEAISYEISAGEAKPEDNSPVREVALTVSTMDGPSLILFEIPELVGIFRLLLFAFYADMGSSRDIAIGPVAVVSLLLRAMLQNEIDPVKNAHYYRWLAFTAALFAGITQATLDILHKNICLSADWDFLSHTGIVEFMGRATITIALQLQKGFLGIKKFTKNSDIV
ncbi:sulfate transporter, partial [Striga asiatica]